MATGLGDNAARRARLLAAIRFTPAESACRACLDNLDGYIAAQLAGQDYAALLPAVAAHLDACPECATAYASLYELEVAEAAGRLPQLSAIAAPDLSFLQSDRPLGSQLADSLRSAVTRLGDRLRFQLSADLLPRLQPPPAVALRTAAGEGRYSQQLLALNLDAGLPAEIPFTMAVYRDNHRPELCLVEVTAALPDRAWPDLAGITVRLDWPGEGRTAVTDPWGLASFEGVPADQLAQMVVEFVLS